MAARVAGPFDDRLDAFFELLIVDAPARRGEYRERTDQSLVHEVLWITGASDGVVARLALAHPVDGGDEVAGREVKWARLGLDELFAKGLLIRRAHRRSRRGCHNQRRVHFSGREEELATCRCRDRARKVTR